MCDFINYQKMDQNTKSEELVESLKNLSLGYNFKTIQSNGQRIVYNGILKESDAQPSKGTEVFIGNLPPDLYEDELLPMFGKAGTIFKLRLMLDFTGRNRGYAFIAYFRQEDAHRAVEMYNNYCLRMKTKIAVSISVDNRRLFLGNLPRDQTADTIKEIMNVYVKNLKNVYVYNEPGMQNLNRGFAFAEFETHRDAAIARRHLAPGNLFFEDKSIFVDWAEPLPTVNAHIMQHVTKLYLSNVPFDLTNDYLITIIYNLLESEHIIKIYKANTYAFIHFTIRKYAEEGLQALQGLKIDGQDIRVEWARPIEYSKRFRITRAPENYCKSVPPTMRKLVNESIAKRQEEKKQEKCFNKKQRAQPVEPLPGFQNYLTSVVKNPEYRDVSPFDYIFKEKNEFKKTTYIHPNFSLPGRVYF